MQNDKLRQAVIIKGIAQQLLSMSVPDFNELDKLLKPFDYTLQGKKPIIMYDKISELESEISQLRDDNPQAYAFLDYQIFHSAISEYLDISKEKDKKIESERVSDKPKSLYNKLSELQIEIAEIRDNQGQDINLLADKYDYLNLSNVHRAISEYLTNIL